MASNYYGFAGLFWFAIFFLLISNFGSWGYSYRAHRRFSDLTSKKGAIDILNERYARGEITQIEFRQMKSEINESERPISQKVA
jgi:putative membrane protein